MMVGYAARILRPEDDQNIVFLWYLLNYVTNGRTEGICVFSGIMQSIPVCQTLCIDQWILQYHLLTVFRVLANYGWKFAKNMSKI